MFYSTQRTHVITAVVAAFTATALLFVSFILFEPQVAFGVDSRQFEITSSITSEISFLTEPGDVDMTGSAINGLTGGTAVGTSTFNITTNDPDGYTVSLAFQDSVAMQGDNINSDIPNYAPTVGGTPDYNFSVTAGEAWFAYTVNNETTPTDIDVTFKDDGSSACGGANTGTKVGACWYNKSDATVAEQIIDAGAATVSTGATSTVVFQVGVGANPNPSLETGTYTATATLTALVK